MSSTPENSPVPESSYHKPEFHEDTRPDEELPHLDGVAFEALVRMHPELRTPQTLEEFGIDFNNDIQAAIIDGRKVYFNTNEADFGTIVRNPLEAHAQNEGLEPSQEHAEVLETANEFPTEVKAFIGSFVTSHEAHIDELLTTANTETAIQDELARIVRELTYGDDLSDITVRRRMLTGQLENLQHLKSLFAHDRDAAEGGLYVEARRFTDESQELADAVSRDESTSDDLRHRTKLLLGAAEELQVNARGVNLVSNDLVDQATKLISYVDGLMNDSWGYEAYVSNITGQLKGLEDALSARRAYMLRAQAELPKLKTLSA